MKNIITSILVILSFISCENTDDLTTQVQQSISKELPQNNLRQLGLETEIIKLELVKREGNEFEGILTTNEVRKKGSKYYNSSDTSDNNFLFEYDVYVISDGKNFEYKIGNKRVVN
jgi:hypothetical protein